MSQKRLLLSISLIFLAALQPVRSGAAKEPGYSSQTGRQTPPAKTTEPKVGDAPPTLEQILDKYVQALGGKAALLAPNSRVMKGAIEAPAIGAKGTIEIYAKAPDKLLTEVALAMAGNPRTGFNGDIAWQEEHGEAKELTVYPKRDADFYLPLKLRELFPRIELKGKEKLGAREVYCLEAPRGGKPRRWYFDTESGLLLRVETRNPEGNLLSREDYEDYRAVDGIQFPFTTRHLDQDQTEIVIKYSEIKHNVPLDDAKFDMPAAKSGGAAPAPQTKQPPHEEALVPMRDGTQLALDLYFPSGPSKGLPVVLERTPYNKATGGRRAAFWTARGYVYAIQDVRGRFRSEGRFEPFLREGSDGFDTIEWLARQPWCSGKVGTIGGSYDALVQWQAAVEQPPHLAAMVVNVPPTDNFPYDGGVMDFWALMQWLHIIRRQKPDDSSPLSALQSFFPKFEKAFDDLPVSGQDVKVFGHVDEIWRRFCSEDPNSDYWKSARYLSKVNRVTVPVLHQSGWFDDCGLGTKLNYLAMMKAGAKNQRLILGPWGHTDTGRKQRGLDFGEAALLDLEQEYADWFAHWLKGEAAAPSDPVKLFVMGENRWMTAASYPPPGQPKRYFLASNFALLPDNGDSLQGSDQYVYDPGDPTPSPRTLGDDEMESRYSKMLAKRKDIVAYRSAPIQEPFKILGPMSAVIHVSSDAPETDLFVRVSEEDPSHGLFLLAEGKSRVRFQGTKPARVEVDLWHTAIRIAKGDRLVVDIASASFPVYARNLNTGENSLTGTVHRKAKVALYRSAEFPSFVEFSSVTGVAPQ
ncbi:MAG TPA: CocE/NonD family hydrolase [Blastocatellia bacterium]|nr:CocE/NonD family hydrolase [Blastocatellia bacterium]